MDEFAEDVNIQIQVCQIPIINKALFEKDYHYKQTLQEDFEVVGVVLIVKIQASLSLH